MNKYIVQKCVYTVYECIYIYIQYTYTLQVHIIIIIYY